jgi:hypothetical protein
METSMRIAYYPPIKRQTIRDVSIKLLCSLGAGNVAFVQMELFSAASQTSKAAHWQQSLSLNGVCDL